MGGTYWYYYKVDEDEECHNPWEPSTTLCPLLPGQRLNVLDMPSEGHGRGYSETSIAFTRDPEDRYLTPVPPASMRPLPSPRVASAHRQSQDLPPPSPWAPRSATYPPGTERYLSPDVMRHARSVSASPRMPSTPILVDFKLLKKKMTSRRASSRAQCRSSTKELDISSPILMSTTNGQVDLVPLDFFRFPGTSAPMTPAPMTPLPRVSTPCSSYAPQRTAPQPSAVAALPTIRSQFNPLASHPVEWDRDSIFTTIPVELPAPRPRNFSRRRSHITSTIVTSEFNMSPSRTRANSADTRRTRHYLFSNDPWLQSPKFRPESEAEQYVADDTPSAPVLSRPSTHCYPPSVALERPISRYGDNISPSLRAQSPTNKELPELPGCLIPAPLFIGLNSPARPAIAEEPAELEGARPYEAFAQQDMFDLELQSAKPGSHFSVWSNSSSCPALDDETDLAQSPVLELPATCANEVNEQRLSMQSTLSTDSAEGECASGCPHLSSCPPQLQLDDLRMASFGQDLFNIDIMHSESTPRRQAACFGLSFYSLPEDETASISTIKSPSISEEVVVKRDSEGNWLVDDFAFLRASVI